MAKLCVLGCGGLVGEGERHAKGKCQIPPHGEKYRRRLRAKQVARRRQVLPQRGAPVAGTGVPKGASSTGAKA